MGDLMYLDASASELDVPLLFVGNDFVQTDIKPA
ncbi:uncharacterized protein with PIN domain [Neorhizobium galegae]|nr:type II toxin-antitoxin system VapC family toxin [Neorhizobium galegae]MBP2550377.1 uncharacterized protein with PIN domain [Neorhizobium galegae]